MITVSSSEMWLDFFFFQVYLFILRETETVWAEEGQGEEERKSQAGSMIPAAEPDVGAQTHKLWVHDLSQNQESVA